MSDSFMVSENAGNSLPSQGPARNTRKLTQEAWLKVRLDYESGNYVTLGGLAIKHGVNQKTLGRRISEQKWNKRKDQIVSRIEKKNEVLLEKKTLSRVEEYLESSFLRAKRYEKIIDASLSQLSTSNDGETPLVEVEDLEKYTRSEQRIHELAKSALRIIDPRSVDITSGGKDIGSSFIDAISQMRANTSLPRLTDQDLKEVMSYKLVE